VRSLLRYILGGSEVKEYCDMTGKEIDSDTVCVVVEPKEDKLTEEFLTF